VRDFGTFQGAAGGWQTWAATANGDGGRPAAAVVNAAGVHGTGAITVTGLATVNESGDEVHFFRHGGPFEFRMSYRINQPDLLERPQVLVAFHKDGIQDVCRLITRDLLFDATGQRSGELRLRIPRLWLGAGTYTVTVMVAREGYYDEEQTRYFSLNPGVYACHTRALEIVVEGGGALAAGTVVVGDGQWSLEP
jgi:hypothetical protein